MDKETGFSTQTQAVRLFYILLFCNLAINVAEDSKSFLSCVFNELLDLLNTWDIYCEILLIELDLCVWRINLKPTECCRKVIDIDNIINSNIAFN